MLKSTWNLDLDADPILIQHVEAENLRGILGHTELHSASGTEEHVQGFDCDKSLFFISNLMLIVSQPLIMMVSMCSYSRSRL